jgi:cytochrome c oxidase assembly protein subunit 15
MSVAATLSRPARDRTRDRGLIAAWLYVVAGMIIAMILVGGATRLTDSGLSITEWKPIHGIIPPFSVAEWEDEFAKYREIPEYSIVNPDMTLAEFKGIFWWEWGHRFLGRIIGFVFLLPFLFFWATGRIERQLWPRLIGIFALGGLQGAVGWWMVASGLTARVDVSQYRLAAHLMLACFILCYVLWVARGLTPTSPEVPGRVRTFAGVLVGLTLFQIYLGALVAGIDAGLIHNTWPLMDGGIIPSGLFAETPVWLNFFENHTTVQFTHRMVAYLLLAAAIAHAIQAGLRLPGSAHARRAILLAVLVSLQAVIGIVTLLLVVPLSAALLHQLGAVVVLTASLLHLRSMTRAYQLEATAFRA